MTISLVIQSPPKCHTWGTKDRHSKRQNQKIILEYPGIYSPESSLGFYDMNSYEHVLKNTQV